MLALKHTNTTSSRSFSIRFGCLRATRAHALFITDLQSTRRDCACGKHSDFSMLMYFPVCHLCLPVFAFYSDLQTTVLSCRVLSACWIFIPLSGRYSRPRTCDGVVKTEKKHVAISKVIEMQYRVFPCCFITNNEWFKPFLRKLFHYCHLCNFFSFFHTLREAPAMAPW